MFFWRKGVDFFRGRGGICYPSVTNYSPCYTYACFQMFLDNFIVLFCFLLDVMQHCRLILGQTFSLLLNGRSLDLPTCWCFVDPVAVRLAYSLLFTSYLMCLPAFYTSCFFSTPLSCHILLMCCCCSETL